MSITRDPRIDPRPGDMVKRLRDGVLIVVIDRDANPWPDTVHWMCRESKEIHALPLDGWRANMELLRFSIIERGES